MARPVAYGQVNDIRSVRDYPAAASQVWEARSGKFVYLNNNVSMQATLASGTTMSNLIGWAQVGTFSGSTTAGQDIIPVNVASDAEYEMPINATQTETELQLLSGKMCDIEISGGIQYADYDASVECHLVITGYKYYGSGTGEQSLLVRLNTPSIGRTGV